MKVGILTDSVADLPPELARELGIHVVPYNVHWGQETFKDGVDLLPEDFYRRLAIDPVLPTTSFPSSGEYAEAYRTLTLDHESIVSLHITGKGSGAYQSACVARDLMPALDITPVDTCAVSMATGYMAVEAARAARRGAGREEVLGVVKSLMANIYQVYAADTLKYLYLGGRIGRAKHMMGSLLRLKPLITMDRDGVIGPVGQALSRQGVLQRIVETMELWAGKAEALKVAVVQGAARADADRLMAMIRNEFQCVEVLGCEFGPALGVHTGPGTLGVAFFRKSAAP
jgi:DegV family protein with EDD domain